MTNNWESLADEKTITATVEALKANDIDAIVVKTGEEAKEKVLDMLPVGAEVMTMTSETLDTIGIPAAIQKSLKHVAIKEQLKSLDPETERKEMKKLAAVHDYVLGSVQAVTENGEVMIASNTGSQIPAYAYGASHVIWVVGTQKIVSNIDEGLKRIYDYILPLESKRVQKAYGMPHSNVSVMSVNY